MSALGQGRRRAVTMLLAALGIGAGVLAYDVTASPRMLAHSDCVELGELAGAYFARVDEFRASDPDNWYEIAKLYGHAEAGLERFQPRTDAMRDEGLALRDALDTMSRSVYRFHPTAANRERLAAASNRLRERVGALAGRCRD